VTLKIEQLYDQYFEFIYLRCVRLVNNPEVAEELCQDTFIKASKSLYRFVPGATHKTWLYTIATNVCLNWLKKASNKKESLMSENLPEPGHSGESWTIEWSMLVEKSLDRSEMQLFALKFLDELTNEEISEQLKCTKRTVINRLNTLKDKVSKTLGEDNPYAARMEV
jgi:RNA polymerase sigma-70 factor (ECF subfamily)